MTAGADPLASFRPIVMAELRRFLDSQSHRHTELLRQQLATSGDNALGADRDLELVATTSIALLEATGAIVRGLSGGAAAEQPLARDWGLPRALNAADAFFAQAQRSLLRLKDSGVGEGKTTEATHLLDRALRGAPRRRGRIGSA
jgi:hypothetical protein